MIILCLYLVPIALVKLVLFIMLIQQILLKTKLGKRTTLLILTYIH